MSDSPDAQKRRLVLVVDDTATVRQMARDALEGIGLEVAEAEDGEKGLRAFSKRRPDLVLLDVNMLGLDGFAVCEEIRRARADENIPVLMMTASDDADSIHRAYEVGATDFITKPLNWLILSQRIRYMLRMSDVLMQLSRSEQRLSKAQRSARLGNWELDLESGAFVCSEEVVNLYGIRSKQAAAGPRLLLSAVHPDDRQLVRHALDRALDEGTEFGLDHRVVTPSGEERHIHLQAEVIFDSSGQPLELSGTAQDVTGRKRAEAEVRFLAYHDSLTGLGNRRLFRERLSHALAQARRDHSIVAVVFLDLDHFKRINDTLSHTMGDTLLQRVSERLRNCVRESDFVSRSLPDESRPTVSRFAGDEFMISLSRIGSAQEAARVAGRVLEVVAHPFDVEGQEVVLTASAGITLAPADGDDVDTLLRNADAAMSYAKSRGRSNFQFYRPSMHEAGRRNLRMETDLRAALDRNQLRLHYQPKVELATGRINGFEALVRWQHPASGLIPPNDFLPVAEQAGLIVPLGEFVLRTACAQARMWRESGFPPMRMSVNFSANQFRTEEVADTVDRVLRDTPLSPRFLDVEVTESTMMENQGIAIRSLQRMKGIGITVSLDDFGTGYSSLSYLKGFPVDAIKIDRSFIRDITRDPDSATITAAIVSMAHTLNLKVVAEGVETEEQLTFLRNCGCDEVQGFLFSRPLPADEATGLLREGADWEISAMTSGEEGDDRSS
jgi:diguanylate cyclase (GGDEF)-like protein/PAS domain S-box-containing protein